MDEEEELEEELVEDEAAEGGEMESEIIEEVQGEGHLGHCLASLASGQITLCKPWLIFFMHP
jgi:hypothetical protein